MVGGGSQKKMYFYLQYKIVYLPDYNPNILHLQQQCHNSKCVIFQERQLKVSKCYNFLWVQRWHSCSPVASFVNCVMTLYLLKVHLQMFLSIPITQKCQILSCDTLVANEQYLPFWKPQVSHTVLWILIYISEQMEKCPLLGRES